MEGEEDLQANSTTLFNQKRGKEDALQFQDKLNGHLRRRPRRLRRRPPGSGSAPRAKAVFPWSLSGPCAASSSSG